MLHPSIGTVIFGRYTLRRQLARGGMGSVWEAADRKLRRAVAVKLLYPLWAKSDEALARFEREAMAVARLQSPHVVQIFDYGVDRECPFIVMELLEGEDLHARLKRCGRLSLEETGPIVVQAAKALSAAHAAGIVHRDLKPGNVYLQRGREEELVKILDFGVAKATMVEDYDQETTKDGAILGTPRYMSPEQALQSRTVDHRTDLWSLAVIIFRALTGRVPFSGKSAADIIVRLCTERPPRATAIAPDLPAELDGFFDRALQRPPEKRFRSARELAAAFAHISPTSYPSLDMPTPAPDIVAAVGSIPPPRPVPRQRRPVPKAVIATLQGIGPQSPSNEAAPSSSEDDDDSPTIGIAGLAVDAASLSDDEAATIVAFSAEELADDSQPELVEVEEPVEEPTVAAEPPRTSTSGVVAQFAETAESEEIEGDTLRQAPGPVGERASGTARWLAAAGAVVLASLIVVIGAIRWRAQEVVTVQQGVAVPPPPTATSSAAATVSVASDESAGGQEPTPPATDAAVPSDDRPHDARRPPALLRPPVRPPQKPTTMPAPPAPPPPRPPSPPEPEPEEPDPFADRL